MPLKAQINGEKDGDMEATRVLIVTQEMDPYLIQSEIAEISRKLPQHIHQNGMEIRVLMPRYGNINERRHRLHEVVRLSGINIIVEDDDYPLIIKVASLPGARLQVYFLDNDDFFQRKTVFRDTKDKFHDDNTDRMVFFCKGVMETVKKFGWPPNIIHCHGWLTSLIPLYLKTAYKDDPIFANTKCVYSVYKNSFKEKLNKNFLQKAPANDKVTNKDLEVFKEGNNSGLLKGGIEYADGVIFGSEKIDKKVEDYISSRKKNKNVLSYVEEDERMEAYQKFYEELLEA